MSQVTSAIDAVKAGVYSLIEQILMGKQKFDTLMQNLEIQLKDLNGTDLNGKDETFRRVHKKYIEVIEASQQNLKAQYELGQQILSAVNVVFTGSKTLDTIQLEVADPLMKIQVQLQPLLENQRKLAEELAEVETQYLSLLPVETEAVEAK